MNETLLSICRNSLQNKKLGLGAGGVNIVSDYIWIWTEPSAGPDLSGKIVAASLPGGKFSFLQQVGVPRRLPHHSTHRSNVHLSLWDLTTWVVRAPDISQDVRDPFSIDQNSAADKNAFFPPYIMTESLTLILCNKPHIEKSPFSELRMFHSRDLDAHW